MLAIFWLRWYTDDSAKSNRTAALRYSVLPIVKRYALFKITPANQNL